MAARATWKGYLKISLVNIPIKVFPATESSGDDLVQPAARRVSDAHPAEEVVPALRARGAELRDRQGLRVREGPLRVMSEEDFDKVRPESTRVIDLVQFADESSHRSDVRRSHLLPRARRRRSPADAFAVMRDGMQGKVGIGKLALYGREYLVAVRPHERGIVMHTLHHAAEIRSIDTVEELNSVPSKVKPEEIEAGAAGDRDFEGPLDLADYKDEYREGLQRIIDAKIAGEEIVAPADGGAAEGRQPDGGAQEEPRRGERSEETSRESGRREAGG